MGIMIASRLQLLSVCRSLETAGLASDASPHLCDPDTRVGKPRRRHIDRQYDRLATGASARCTSVMRVFAALAALVVAIYPSGWARPGSAVGAIRIGIDTGSPKTVLAPLA